MHKLWKLAISLIFSVTAGAIGSLATFPNLPTWYAMLEKPVFNPPNWVFGPVWTLLYILMGVGLYLVWVTPYKSKQSAYVAFGIQLALNTAWSLVFFGLHWLWVSVAVILALLITILATIKLFWPISKPAALLLLPYAAWVGFATAINVAVAWLN